jgi:cell division protein FtsX
MRRDLMDFALIMVLAVLLGCFLIFMMAAREIEARHERWWEYHHPPDRTLEDDDDDDT